MSNAIGGLGRKSDKNKCSFVSALVGQEGVSSSAITHFIAADFGLPVFDISSLSPEAIPQEFLKEELLEQYDARGPYSKTGKSLVCRCLGPNRQ